MKNIFFTCVKLGKDSSANYYQNKQRNNRKKSFEKYGSLFKKEKKQYGCGQYKNISENETSKLVEYR